MDTSIRPSCLAQSHHCGPISFYGIFSPFLRTLNMCYGKGQVAPITKDMASNVIVARSMRTINVPRLSEIERLVVG